MGYSISSAGIETTVIFLNLYIMQPETRILRFGSLDGFPTVLLLIYRSVSGLPDDPNHVPISRP